MTDLLRSQTEGFRPVDAWSIPLEPHETDDAQAWAWGCFDAMSPAITLLKIRDAIVRRFGGVTWTGADGFLDDLRATSGASSGQSASDNADTVAGQDDDDVVASVDSRMNSVGNSVDDDVTAGNLSDQPGDPGDSPAGRPFPWTSLKGDREVVFGIDDKHLDFRLGIATLNDRVTVTTMFRLHNALGRLYWSVIRLFHPLIVLAMLRRVQVPERQPVV
jgi:hypothetical protein